MGKDVEEDVGFPIDIGNNKETKIPRQLKQIYG